MKYIVPALCEYFVEKGNFDPSSKDDRIIIHCLCLMTLGRLESFTDKSLADDLSVIASSKGPRIVAVKQWCKEWCRKKELGNL